MSEEILGKAYIINCSVLDTRKVTEGSLEGFTHMIANAEIVLQNEKSKEILGKISTIMNNQLIIDTEEQGIVKENFLINSDTEVEENTVYVVTGKLEIEPNSEEILNKFSKVYVTGSAKYPQSVEKNLENFKFSGAVLCYPDGSVIMKNHTIIDDIFEITSRENATYFAKNKIVITNIDLDPIIAKNIKFHTKTLVVDRNLLKKALPMFNADVELIVLPENSFYFNGKTNLSSSVIKKTGGNIYVDGNVTVTGETVLENIKKLTVNGDVRIIKRLENAFSEIDATYNQMIFTKGKIIANNATATVDKFILEQNADGVSVENTGTVTIKKDASCELICERLSLKNCGKVNCSDEQESAVQLVAINCGNISTKSDKSGILNIGEEIGLGDMGKIGLGDVGKMFKSVKNVLKSKIINADYYVL